MNILKIVKTGLLLLLFGIFFRICTQDNIVSNIMSNIVNPKITEDSASKAIEEQKNKEEANKNLQEKETTEKEIPDSDIEHEEELPEKPEIPENTIKSEEKLLDSETDTEEEEEESLEKEVKDKDIKDIKNDSQTKEKQDKISLNKTKEEEEEEVQEINKSLNTFNVDEEGNWLLKRIWWEQSENAIEKIINANSKIIEVQMYYFNRRSTVTKSMDNLLRKIGYDQGELAESIKYLVDDIHKERLEHGDLSIEERQLLEKVTEKKSELETLKSNLEKLTEIDSKLDNVLNQVVNQVNKCRQIEAQSWNDFKSIGRILNDKKAKVLFYQIETNLKNIHNIFMYLNGELKKYFEDLLAKIEQLSNSIVSQTTALHEDGIHLKNDMEKIKKAEELRKIKKPEIKEKPKPKGWFQSIIDWFKSIIKWFTGWFK